MNYSMKIGGMGAIAMAVALVVSCGGSSSGDSESPAAATTIDDAAVTKGISTVAALMPVCSGPGPAKLAPVQGDTGAVRYLSQAKRLALSLAPRRTILALGSTQPADTLGVCGGRMTYPSYSHSSGVTTGTLAFENYCIVNTDSNERAVLNGSIVFVDTGTPSASGPIRNKLEANSPTGVTIATQSATGQPLDSTLISFNNFLYSVGIPGSVPTAGNPDRFTLGELKATTKSSGKTYRETDFKVEMIATATGGQQFNVSGRGYRSGGEYFDVSTVTPLILDAEGSPTAGAVAFVGANNTSAVATLMAGSVLQATMTVNGRPMLGLPACK